MGEGVPRKGGMRRQKEKKKQAGGGGVKGEGKQCWGDVRDQERWRGGREQGGVRRNQLVTGVGVDLSVRRAAA